MLKQPIFSNRITTNQENQADLVVIDNCLVQGNFSGNISAPKASQVVIGIAKTAVFKGDVSAYIVIVEGRVEGNIFAEHLIEIHSGGFVIGEVDSPEVIIEPGAMAFRYRQVETEPQ